MKVVGISEHLVQIEGESHQSLILDIVLKLSANCLTLFSGHDCAPDQEFEGVWHLKLVELCVWNLRHGTDGAASRLRTAFSDVDRDERAGVDVAGHRSPRLSANTSDAPGVRIRSPKTACARASRSGHGETGAVARTGASRATGRRRRVTSMT